MDLAWLLDGHDTWQVVTCAKVCEGLLQHWTSMSIRPEDSWCICDQGHQTGFPIYLRLQWPVCCRFGIKCSTAGPQSCHLTLLCIGLQQNWNFGTRAPIWHLKIWIFLCCHKTSGFIQTDDSCAAPDSRDWTNFLSKQNESVNYSFFHRF